VGRVLRLTLLAPDIVEAIMDGRQPTDLQLEDLPRRFPVEWRDYSSNDEAAQKFKAETGSSVYKWNVSSFDACAAGWKQVETDLGPH
jgi:hypothetical protein